MMNIKKNIEKFQKILEGTGCRLVAVTKTKSDPEIMEAYKAGHKIFGENKVQELVAKHERLPKDILWHMIGHLQRNKVKYLAPFISLIHSVDSIKLLREINKQALKAGRIIPCLLQVHIAQEETKFGFDKAELFEILSIPEINQMSGVIITGLMGMATFTNDENQIRREFRSLSEMYRAVKELSPSPVIKISELSMGMTNDYAIAIEEGSTLIRVGSAIFGPRS